MADLLIRGAKVVDGTGAPWYKGDLAVAGDTIVKMGRITDKEAYKRVIDADGLILSPGFIDMHSHSDLMQLADPLGSAKIRQGITTELLGQDGLGVAPMEEGVAANYRQYLTGLLGNPAIDWSWGSFADYLKALEGPGTATNLAVLVSHGPLRLLAVGMDERPATTEELNKIDQLATQAMEQGAFGFSTGLIYPPCVFGNDQELSLLARVTATAGGIFVVHVRNERDLLEESIQEIFDLGRQTGVAPHISHLKVMGKENWGQAGRILNLFEEARREGLEAAFDQYPYPAGSTMLSILIPAHAHAGGPEALLARLKNPQTRAVLSRQMAEGLPGWENIATAAGWDGILVTGVPEGANKKWEGQSLANIALKRGCSPQEVVFDLLLEERLEVSMVNFSMHPEDVAAIMQHPMGMLGTDGLLGGKPHPRAYGSTARILQKFVREEGILGLEQAVSRMTCRAAARLGLYDRGLLRPGLKADLVLFDPDAVEDRATFTDPCQFPGGFEYVFVNGLPALERGQETGVLSGRVLRKNR
ncbi:N-acyl-D-amino-acid deacylase family protein [Desulforamulus aquiferis]|uniref:D-aminoacylase n=1 Tax=Desulforamulus aquiferis TaxID=1397668 RepID=A0AAW7ZKJ8_9FIRM|nr:D-aminoacylase [Desulforamulus aquiferis]MDO7788835.1 D-aminoacylase [Desulforamulus aquiferis]